MRSENVGTSNHNPVENTGGRKPKVSLAMTVSQGLVGPKAMAKAGVDGHAVNIPQPSYFSDGATEEINKSILLDLCC